MEERPPEIRRHLQTSPATRALAALGGLILGVGVLAAIAFAVVGRDSGASSDHATQAATTPALRPIPGSRILAGSLPASIYYSRWRSRATGFASFGNL